MKKWESDDDDPDDFKHRTWKAERDRDRDWGWRDRTERLIRSAEAKARNPELHLDVDEPADWQVEALVKAGCWPRKRTQAEREWAGVPVLEQRLEPVKRQDEIVFRPKHLRAV